MQRTSQRTRHSLPRRGSAGSLGGSLRSQRGQAMVEYLVGTLFVVLAVAVIADPSLFGITRDLLQALKDYFQAFAYAISVAAT